jgi:hypothetical protein
MNARGLIAFITLVGCAKLSQVPPTRESRDQTPWQVMDQLCGQLEWAAPKTKQVVVGGKAESRSYTVYLEGATMSQYPATSSEKECCDAKPMATVRSRKYGAFEFEGVPHGVYWLRVQKNELNRLIPVRITHDFDVKACRDPSVGRSVLADSNPPKIEIRIR